MLTPGKNRTLGIYIHVPFCAKKCPYCDFNSYALSDTPSETAQKLLSLEPLYVQAVIRELKHYATRETLHGRTCETVFFGGGTPSLLSSKAVAELLEAIRSHFTLSPNAEITLEANPGTIEEEVGARRFAEYRDAGVTRISLGCQSFKDDKLKTLGRLHSASDTLNAIEIVRNTGFQSFNLDLMFGVCNESLGDWKRELQQVVSFQPDHISTYGLTIEPGTEFGRRARKGEELTAGEEPNAAMYRESLNVLRKHGYERYEISNYAKPERQSRHNVRYWKREDYLGLGPGAHSFLAFTEASDEDLQVRVGGEARDNENGSIRWWNIPGPDQYMMRCSKFGNGFHRGERLTAPQEKLEFFLLHLRLTDGFSKETFANTFGTALSDAELGVFSPLEKMELLTSKNDRVCLTEKGFLFSDTVFSALAEHL